MIVIILLKLQYQTLMRDQLSPNNFWRANQQSPQGILKNNESQMDRYHNSKSVWFSADKK